MFHFLYYKKLLQINIQTLQIQSLQNPFLKSYCQTNPPSSLLQYLQKSLGFSPEEALTASKRLKHKTPKNPDAVLTFLKSQGFSKTHIKSIINRIPQLLSAMPESSLRPKIQFFKEKGLSESDVVGLIVAKPNILTASLEKRLKPFFYFLHSLLGADRVVIDSLKQPRFGFDQYKMVSNLTILQNCGVPNHHVLKFLVKEPAVLAADSARFNEAVKMVQEMGFDSSTRLFMEAVRVILKLSRPVWDMKFKVYRSFGWSDKEILSAFRRHPICIMLSEEKIRRGLDFFMKELDWSPSYSASYAALLLLNLEKRILPRHRLLQFLASKGLIRKYKKLGWSFVMGEEKFMEKYVMKYRTEVPEILEIYEGMIGSKGLDIKDG
ncbi:transcription termination factor MTERF8, chloroplastic-like [Magnolia sinica]|uniref:transcription termination factor MTERF8, chloroplastic-like n=1 Tax=Magnolia sinica TaxID=86752 RepID=UPI00265A872A|nr:transcription termination factor MTERF8, chloroplastic-like [Magnolia sinica]XP_058079885.1 transcription termination factor MTERF8, chloroplastic-like [Magnolia sinica]XP_058079886.1 transcription termination factor MTERF8, chloroplastic-like [Magnolia sinica]